MSDLPRILDALCHAAFGLEGATRDLEAHLVQVARPASESARVTDAVRHNAWGKLCCALRYVDKALDDLRQTEETDADS